MKSLGIAALAAAGILSVFIPGARADEWNKKTIFTFSGPVEIPGHTLAAGTYVFKLVDSESDRNIVQVFNKDQTHLYGTFLTIPDYRLNPRGKPVVLFEERAAGAPQAVKAWFYPGDNYGNEFVYPKVRATELAQQTQQAVPSMPQEMESNTQAPASTMQEQPVQSMKQAPLMAQQPSGGQVEITQEFNTTPPAPMASNTLNRELPKTGSSLPLLALVGLLTLGGGVSLLAVARSNR